DKVATAQKRFKWLEATEVSLAWDTKRCRPIVSCRSADEYWAPKETDMATVLKPRK
ncbi:unnamed protein product, partial [Amoebophrya sp. A25]